MSGPAPVDLVSGEHAARLDPRGASLHGLRHRGRELVLAVPGPVPLPPYAGAVLVPWPNRVADGRWSRGGRVHQLPVNEVERGNALHGLGLWEAWTVRDRTGDAVTFEHVVQARPGYPFTVRATASYELSDAGLDVTLTAQNLGEESAPVGLSFHPYLQVGDGRDLDTWTMTLPCDAVVSVDERLLPTGEVPVGELDLDHTSPRLIGAAVIDHAFTGVTAEADGRARARLSGPDGTGVEVSWGPECRWLQVYTLMAPGAPYHRGALAIEPMTCAPDAFNNGRGLVELEPGAETSMSCRIAGTSADPDLDRLPR